MSFNQFVYLLNEIESDAKNAENSHGLDYIQNSYFAKTHTNWNKMADRYVEIAPGKKNVSNFRARDTFERILAGKKTNKLRIPIRTSLLVVVEICKGSHNRSRDDAILPSARYIVHMSRFIFTSYPVFPTVHLYLSHMRD